MIDEIKAIPNSPQETLLRSSVREVGYGGQAGGAKSFGLVLDCLYQLNKPGYNAILFRRTYKRLKEADGLIDLTKKIYPALGGVYNQTDYTWTFPQYHNNTIRLSHMEHEKNADDYSGSQYAWIGFDELQEFLQRQYLFLFSRNRSSNPDIDLYIRSTFNPGGIGHFWIKKRFEPHIPESQQVRYFKRENGLDIEVDSSDPLSIGRIFIQSKLEDNPYLYLEGKGDYEKGLHQLEDVDFRRLRHGDWDVRRTGRVYYSFTDENLGPDSREIDYSKVVGYYHSHDFGAVNHVWGLWAKIGNQYFLVDEQQLPEGTTPARAVHIKSIFGDKNIVAGWGGAASEKQYRLDFAQAGVNIRVPPTVLKSNEEQIVESQVRQTNKNFEQKTLMICSDMVRTIDQLENCVRDEKEGIMDKAKWHFNDMVRYFSTGISRTGWTW